MNKDALVFIAFGFFFSMFFLPLAIYTLGDNVFLPCKLDSEKTCFIMYIITYLLFGVITFVSILMYYIGIQELRGK